MSDMQRLEQAQAEIATLRQRVAELEAQAAQAQQITAALQRSEHRFATLFRASPVAVVISTGTDGRYVDVNDHFARLTGYTRDEVIGRTSRDLGIWVQRDERDRIGLLLLTQPVITDIELTFWTKAKEARTVLASLAMIDLDGTPCVLTMCHDITERQQIAAERERLLHETEAAVQVRDDFLSIAAHEFRTPLAALQLHMDSMQRVINKAAATDATAQRLQPKLETAYYQTGRLATLIDELLDVTLIREGRSRFEIEVVDLASIARRVAARFEEQVQRTGTSLDLRTASGSLIKADPSCLDQIVTNLLANALKYGRGQPVELAVHTLPATVELVVRDHGIGIATHDQQRIFDRFERAVSSNNYGGLGLGLYVVQQLVTAFGGTIKVESDVGNGATFTATFPRHQPSTEQHA